MPYTWRRCPTIPEDTELPDEAVHLQAGTYVIVRKLEKAQYLNGMTGKILDYNSTTGRYGVLLTMALFESKFGGVPAERRAIKATNLEAVIPGDAEKWTDIIMDDDEEWAEDMEIEGTKWYDVDDPRDARERLHDGKALPTDYENPHFRRLASKLLKAGIYLDVPELMDQVSSLLHHARKKEASEIMKKQGARIITRGEIMQRIMTDPELEHTDTGDFGTELL